MTDIRTDLEAALARRGPMLGKELVAALPGHSHLALWQACWSDAAIQISHFSRYYLRYDITRADMVRLSPSILRDFLSFTLLSLPGQREGVIERQVGLSNHHRDISVQKIRIARNILIDVLAGLDPALHRRLCAFIAGDLAYFLGHAEPRLVKDQGIMVNGSDIDIILVHDDIDEAVIEGIDRAMLQAKAYYLRHPAYRQEVDFICKSKARMTGQFRYGDIHEKIASKIAYESMFLAGSVELYGEIKDEMERCGVNGLIEADFAYGLADRKRAMRELLKADPDALDTNTESLFYFSQERIEFR